MRSPRTRYGASPALRFLRETLFAAPSARSPWADRLAAGGIVREIARVKDLRRALPTVEAGLVANGGIDRMPADERRLLLAARLAAADNAARVARTLGALGDALAPTSVRPLLLKGTALHGDLHPVAALRPVSDIDAYVAPGDASELRSALAAAAIDADPLTAARWADFDASGGRAHRLSDLIARPRDGRGLPIEVKLDPVQVGLPLRRGEAFLAGARPSPVYRGFLVPSAESMAVQQAIHLARHDGSDLLWWAELAHGVGRAVRRDAFDVDRARSLLAGEGLLATACAAFAEAEALFPGTIPASLRRAGPRAGWSIPRFRGSPRRAGPPNERAATWGLQVAHGIGAGRPCAALSALWRRVWPGAAYVRARLGLPVDSPVGAGARVRRLVRTLRGRPV